MIIRFFDIFLSLFGLIFGLPLLLLVFVLGFFDTGSPLFFQKRVGKGKTPFILVKFRTMKKETKDVATHLVQKSSVTKLGNFLRKTKLDELPQLWNVLKGEMSLVGPRPCLFNQDELLRERDKLGVYQFRPGVTGLAQLQGIDMSTPELLAKKDIEMMYKLSIIEYFRYIVWTALGGGRGDRIKNE